MTSDNQERQEDKALRDQIAAALLAVQTNGLCKLGRVCEECDCFSDGDGGKSRDELLRGEADAVLPVVQAHTQALRQADCAPRAGCGCACHRMPGVSHVAACCDVPPIEDMTSCGIQVTCFTAMRDLSSLRSAVAQLADQLDEAVQTIPAFDPAGLGRRGGLRDAARLLRSLLPQEGPDKEGAER